MKNLKTKYNARAIVIKDKETPDDLLLRLAFLVRAALCNQGA